MTGLLARATMLRWSLLLLILGAGLIAVGIEGGRRNATARPLTLAEALDHARASRDDYVVLRAGPGPNPAGRLYSLVPDDDIRTRPERLSPYSPVNGYPLLAADALPVAQWNALEGVDVSASAGLRSEPLFLSKTSDVSLNGRILASNFVTRRMLAPLETETNLWVLSDEHGTLGRDPSLASILGSQPSLKDEEREWIASRSFQGVLHRFKDFPFDGFTLDEIKAQYGGSSASSPVDLDNAWLIDTAHHRWWSNSEGWHAYAPVQGGGGAIWVRVPLDDDRAETWDHPTVTGVWLPPGRHAFAPPGAPQGGVALILTGSKDVKTFLHDRWLGHWGFACLVAGASAVVLAGLLLIIRIVRSKYDKPGLPDYLAPFDTYLVRDSVWGSRVRAVLGPLALLLGIVAALVTIVTNDALRSQRFRDAREELYLNIAFYVSAPLMPLMFVLGGRLRARGGVTVLRNDGRKPILYLRSFTDDAGFVDRWSDMLSILFTGLRYETYERSLARAVSDVGPLIAIGKPGELLPALGAARMYVDHDHWQQVVETLVAQSRLVILRAGRTPGFWWELKHVVNSLPPGRVVLFLPSKDRKPLYKLLRDRAQEVLPQPLPPYEELGGALFLGFGPGWEPRPHETEGYSLIARFRHLVSGSPAPIVREALNPALRVVGVTWRRPPLAPREWFLLAIPIALVIALSTLFMMVLYQR